MCTKDETAEVINHEFWKQDGLKDQLIIEVHKALDARIGKWFIAGGAAMIFIIASAYFTLYNQVQKNTERIEQTFTQDQAALITQRIEQLFMLIEDRNDTLKELDARLRAKGI